LGRSGIENKGLITFKDRWGAARSTLTYARYSSGPTVPPSADWKLRIAKQIFAHAPDSFLSAAGNIFYKHIG
jgi:hypothetical protein